MTRSNTNSMIITPKLYQKTTNANYVVVSKKLPKATPYNKSLEVKNGKKESMSDDVGKVFALTKSIASLKNDIALELIEDKGGLAKKFSIGVFSGVEFIFEFSQETREGKSVPKATIHAIGKTAISIALDALTVTAAESAIITILTGLGVFTTPIWVPIAATIIASTGLYLAQNKIDQYITDPILDTTDALIEKIANNFKELSQRPEIKDTIEKGGLIEFNFNNLKAVISNENISKFGSSLRIFGSDNKETFGPFNEEQSISSMGGNDTIFLNHNKATIDGGSGNDEINYQNLNIKNTSNVFKNFLKVDLENNKAEKIIDGKVVVDSLVSIENVVGSKYNDLIIGNSANNILKGGIGNDEIKGGAGNDTIFGNSGNDSLYGNTGNDILIDGSGNNILIGGEGNDTYLIQSNLDKGGVFRIRDNDGEIKIGSSVKNSFSFNGSTLQKSSSQNLFLKTTNGKSYNASLLKNSNETFDLAVNIENNNKIIIENFNIESRSFGINSSLSSQDKQLEKSSDKPISNSFDLSKYKVDFNSNFKLDLGNFKNDFSSIPFGMSQNFNFRELSLNYDFSKFIDSLALKLNIPASSVPDVLNLQFEKIGGLNFNLDFDTKKILDLGGIDLSSSFSGVQDGIKEILISIADFSDDFLYGHLDLTKDLGSQIAFNYIFHHGEDLKLQYREYSADVAKQLQAMGVNLDNNSVISTETKDGIKSFVSDTVKVFSNEIGEALKINDLLRVVNESSAGMLNYIKDIIKPAAEALNNILGNDPNVRDSFDKLAKMLMSGSSLEDAVLAIAKDKLLKTSIEAALQYVGMDKFIGSLLPIIPGAEFVKIMADILSKGVESLEDFAHKALAAGISYVVVKACSAAGAAIGTAILPVIGGFIGGIIGSIVGSMLVMPLTNLAIDSFKAAQELWNDGWYHLSRGNFDALIKDIFKYIENLYEALKKCVEAIAKAFSDLLGLSDAPRPADFIIYQDKKDDSGGQYIAILNDKGGVTAVARDNYKDDLIGNNKTNDNLIGGNDVNNIFGRNGDDFLDGRSGDDILVGGNGADILIGGEGNDTIIGDGLKGDFDGIETKRIETKISPDNIEGMIAAAEAAAEEAIAAAEAAGLLDDFIIAGNGNDKVFAGRGNDIIIAGSGEDTVSGEDGDDIIYGNDGNDTISGDAGNDLIFGGNGNDIVKGGEGNDIILGNNGDDFLSGDNGNDILFGGNGNDYLLGGDGDDLVISSAGNDTLYGGLGNDEFYITKNANSTTTLADFNPLTDKINLCEFEIANLSDLTYQQIGNDLSLNLGDNQKLLFKGINISVLLSENFVFDNMQRSNVEYLKSIDAINQNLELSLAKLSVESEYSYKQAWFKEIYVSTLFGLGRKIDRYDYRYESYLDSSVSLGNYGNDTIFSGNDDDRLFANAGSDSINSGGGDDFINSGSGSDDIDAGNGDNLIFSGNDDDTVISYNGNDYIDTGSGNNSVNSGDGNDIILSYSGNDAITAGNGNNFITTGKGDDSIRTGNGNNFIITGEGNDSINTGNGNNKIWSNLGNDYIKTGNGNNEIYDQEGDNEIYVGTGNNKIFLGNGNNLVIANSGNDFINLGDGDNIIDAGDGDNKIIARQGNNEINSGYGADFIDVGDGDNIIISGDGNDNVATKNGNNTILTLAGDDSIVVGDGNNYIEGGSGNDEIFALSGDNSIYGGEGNDNIDVGDGDNYIEGGEGDDKIFTGNGNNIIFTGTGNDEAYSGEGDDQIFVDSTNFLINDASGNDFLKINNLKGNIVIENNGEDTDVDIIEFDYNQLPNLKLTKAGDNLIINLTNSPGSITIKNQFLSNKKSRIEFLKFGENLINICSFTIGTSGNDILNGTFEDDVILGELGKDVIFGNDGNDLIDGGEDDDLIYGGAGDDKIKGSEDNDIIFGGEGNDILIGNGGEDILNGGAGKDIFMASQPGDIDIIEDFVIGEDKIDLSSYGYFNSLKNLQYFSSSIQLVENNVEIAFDSNSKFIIKNNSLENLIKSDNFIFDIAERASATDKNDILTGTKSDDFINDGKGSDIISGGLGKDIFKITKNATDIDTIKDFNSNEKIDLKEFNNIADFLQLKANFSQKSQTAGYINTLFGLGREAIVTYDTVINLEDNQKILLENIKTSQLFAKNFQFAVFEGMPQTQRYSGLVNYNFAQDNVIEKATSGIAGSGINTSSFEQLIASGIGYNSSNLWNNGNIWNEGINRDLVNNEYYVTVGGKWDRHDEVRRDTIFNGSERGWFCSNSFWFYYNGNDRMGGGWWDETINAGSGNDEVYAYYGNDIVSAGDGNDYVQGQAGNDSLFGESGYDGLVGGDGNDYLDGGADNDYLDGGAGNDSLYGGTGSDMLFDLDGNNLFYGQDGNDQITAGAGGDYIVGGTGNDYIIADAGGDCIYGGDGNDYIDAGEGNDTVIDSNGNNLVYLGKGDDTACLGNGDEYIDGGEGNDTIYSGAGNDTIIDLSGNDYIEGGAGNDVIYDSSGNNWLHGGAGSDQIQGGVDADIIYGGSGEDLIYGNDGSDLIYGGTNNDKIYGGNNDDIIYGMSGNDQISGGDGNDMIFGNIDFTYGSKLNFLQTAFTNDKGWYNSKYPRQLADVNGDGKADIVGFAYDGVYVAISKGNGAFENPYKASSRFSETGGGWIYQDRDTRLLGDINGDGRADIVGFGGDGVYVSHAKSDGTFTNEVKVMSGYYSSNSGWTQNQHPRQLADVNGDGKVDIVGFTYAGVEVVISNGDGTFGNMYRASSEFGYYNWDNNQDRSPRLLGDINGDGRADIVGFTYDGVYVGYAKSDGTFTNKVKVISGYGANSGWTSQNITNRQLADINGDGKVDIVGINSSGIIASISLGDGNFLAPISLTTEITGANDFDYRPRELADINGDGKADIVSFDQSLITTCLNNNGLDRFSENFNFLEGKKLSSGNFGSENSYKKFMLDTNKDGKEDLVYVYSGPSGVYTYTALANGDGSFGNLVGGKTSTLGGFGGIDSYQKFINDVNGDGLKDIVLAYSGADGAKIYTSLSNGDGTFKTVSGRTLSTLNLGSDNSYGSKLNFLQTAFTNDKGWYNSKYPRQLADVNGDGMADIVGFAYDGVYVAISKGNGAFENPYKASSRFSETGGGWIYQDRDTRLLGDINGDGRADIVGFGGDGVFVSHAKSDGTFTNEVKVMSGYYSSNSGWTQNKHPRQLADVNGDGKVDIVGFTYAGVEVVISNGDGTFGNMYRASSEFGYYNWDNNQDRSPRLLGDINGDGRADIVGFADDGVYVGYAKSDGTFTNKVKVISGYGANSGWTSQNITNRQLADINGDGKVDIVGINSSGIIASISLGDGNFLAPISLTKEITGANDFDYRPRELADINGDGKADIVSFDQSLITTCLSNFGSENSYKKFMLDTNKDGKEDLVYVYSGSDGVYTYTALANGDGSFGNLVGGKTSTLGGFGGIDSYQKFINDVNGDGLKDIVLAYSGADGAKIYTSLSNGDGTFKTVSGRTLSTLNLGNENSYKKFMLDTNKDGKEDLVYVYSGSDGVYTYTALANGDGTFANLVGGKTSPLILGSFGGLDSYKKMFTDLNGDGNKDLICVFDDNSANLTIYTSLSNGNGTFGEVKVGIESKLSFNANLYEKILFDANNDGKDDLAYIYSGSDGAYLSVAFSNGDGTFTNDFNRKISDNNNFGNYNSYQKIISDLNGDGLKDIVLAYSGADGVSIYSSLNTKSEDIISGDAGNDMLTGSAGSDQIEGGEGNDIIRGGRGNDTLNGGNGSDVIYDEDGNDIINGGMGNDVIYAGKGADIISGNQGNDIFSFESLLSSTAQEIDTIIDFNNQEDLIDISNVGIKSFDSLEITNNGVDTAIKDKNSSFIFKLSGTHLLTQDDFII